MCIDKGYKPCTINIRLSSLKCYLNWLFKNKYVKENYSLVLKKVKRPEDTIKPLNDTDVRKMISAPNRDTYSGSNKISTVGLAIKPSTALLPM